MFETREQKKSKYQTNEHSKYTQQQNNKETEGNIFSIEIILNKKEVLSTLYERVFFCVIY